LRTKINSSMPDVTASSGVTSGMPSWTDEEGYNWFNKLECKRCLQRFDADKRGEVPVHDCIGGRFRSDSDAIEHHYPVRVE
jgi:hypothetical protein